MTAPRVCPDHLGPRMHDAVRFSPLYRPAAIAVTGLIAAGYGLAGVALRLVNRKAPR